MIPFVYFISGRVHVMYLVPIFCLHYFSLHSCNVSGTPFKRKRKKEKKKLHLINNAPSVLMIFPSLANVSFSFFFVFLPKAGSARSSYWEFTTLLHTISLAPASSIRALHLHPGLKRAISCALFRVIGHDAPPMFLIQTLVAP